MEPTWTLILSSSALIVAVAAAAVAASARRRLARIGLLLAQVAEAEEALAGLYDKYNTMAARFRKREQRAADADGGEAVVPSSTPEKDRLRSAVNRAWLAARRGITVPTMNGEAADVGSDSDQ